MTEVTFHKLFEEYQESGLSVRDFCLNQDIAVSTFYYWKKKQDKKDESLKEFVPLIMGSQQLKRREQQNNFPLAYNDRDHNNVPLEFIFPNGTKVLLNKSINIALLKTIVHLYD